jgi:hypothetical protein
MVRGGINGSHLIDQHLVRRTTVYRLENADAIQMIVGWKFCPQLLRTVSICRRIHSPHRSTLQQFTEARTMAAIQKAVGRILATTVKERLA